MKTILNLISQYWKQCEEKEQQQRWVRVIYRDDTPLITRYYICSTRWIDDSDFFIRHSILQRFLGWASFRFVLHQMHNSDPDGLHDHPWPWASWVLTGGYYEDTPEGRFFRPPGHLRFRPAKSFHRLIKPPLDDEVWTLFLMGKRQREWGFMEGNKWIPWYNHS
jgi:hypothetical protein